jgi:cytochrome c-type biogenesis protein CcmH
MLTDLGNQIDQGKSNDAIMTYFVDKYGTTVLAAPPASGFNLAAWITPFAALGIGMLMAIYFVRRFRSRAIAPAANPEMAKYQDRLEEELRKYTPED